MDKLRLGKTEMMVSRVGFGSIPIQRVSDDEAVAVIKRCLDLGINYIDTANGYTTSEGRIGKAIAGRREGLILATKSRARTGAEMASHLKLSLERLGVESIDLFQFHDISKLDAYEQIVAPGGPLAVLQEAKKAGKVKHIGVTCHSMDVAKKLVSSGHFETIMFPFNFITSEPGDELLPLTRKHDVGFIAMKPMAGGMLENPTIAFKYLLQFPDAVPLIGIEKTHETDDIARILAGPWQMTKAEEEEMRRLKNELGTRFCRRCDYCQPCTEGIPISQVMTVPAFFKRVPPEVVFSGWIAEGLEKALKCSQCGNCEARCPFGLPIIEMVAEYGNYYQVEKKKYQGGLAAVRNP